MKSRVIFVVIIIAMLASIVFAQAQRKHLNPMVDLLAEKKPVFGISPPTVAPPQNAQPGGGGGGRGEAAAQTAATGPDMCGVVHPLPLLVVKVVAPVAEAPVVAALLVAPVVADEARRRMPCPNPRLSRKRPKWLWHTVGPTICSTAALKAELPTQESTRSPNS